MFFLSLSLNSLSSLKSQINDQEGLNFEELENYLKTAEIEFVDKESLSGRTAPWTIGLNNGTTERRGIFKHLFLVDCMKERVRISKKIEPPDPEKFQNALEEIKVFDNLVRNEDCLNPDDVFIHNKDWRVCRVDYSTAFLPDVELIPGCYISRCSRKLYNNLLNLDSELVKSKLMPYLNNQEIETLLRRKELIIGIIQQLIKEKGEDAVLYSM